MVMAESLHMGSSTRTEDSAAVLARQLGQGVVVVDYADHRFTIAARSGRCNSAMSNHRPAAASKIARIGAHAASLRHAGRWRPKSY